MRNFHDYLKQSFKLSQNENINERLKIDKNSKISDASKIKYKELEDICEIEEINQDGEEYTIMVLSDYADADDVIKQIKNDDYDSPYVLEDITSNWDEYDWDDDQELLINYAVEFEGHEIYQIMDGIGDFSQSIGIVVII